MRRACLLVTAGIGLTVLASPGTAWARVHRPSGQATHFSGVPSVGALFYRNGSGHHFCTASVIHGIHHNLLITAAHCLIPEAGDRLRSRVAFVPGYSRGRRPYGTWRLNSVFVDSRWVRHSDPRFDVAFATVRRSGGLNIEDVTHANRLVFFQGLRNHVRVIGYPLRKWDRYDTAIRCDRQTYAYRGHMRFDCGGFYGGTSGGPWLMNLSRTTRTGNLIGVIGGYQRGGKYPDSSYTSYFGRQVRWLYAYARELS